MATEAFTPTIDATTNLQTCIQLTTGAATANTRLPCRQFLIKSLTNPCYIRLGPSDVTVSAVNGYYMAVGDEERFQISKGVTHIAYLQVTGAGALSVCPLESD
jgi:hypothetical protein